MPTIHLEMLINAPIEICFDLSRSIDLHQVSTSKTNERAIAGKTFGLIELDESVTWEATHLFVRQRLTSIITKYEKPIYFRDEQVKGAFQYIKHDHFFEEKDGKTLMRDIFEFKAPLGILGRLAEWLFLTNYMKKFLIIRNNTIREYAETDLWRKVLNQKAPKS
jgi:ligand-binding SRPBCC domain-containing protein